MRLLEVTTMDPLTVPGTLEQRSRWVAGDDVALRQAATHVEIAYHGVTIGVPWHRVRHFVGEPTKPVRHRRTVP